MPQRKLFDKKTLDTLRKSPLYSQDGKGGDATVYARIFNQYGRGVFYLTEYDGDDTFFGYYKTHEDASEGEYGYISKKELENTRVNVMGSEIVRYKGWPFNLHGLVDSLATIALMR